jgi:hypothetical protein
MASTNNKKEPERLSVMVPKDCKSDIDYIIASTGIKSNGELFRLMLSRYKDDFVVAYNQFFAPTNVTPQQTIEADASIPVPVTEPKPLTNAMSF